MQNSNKSLFNVTKIREAISTRWRNEQYKAHALKQLDAMQKATVPGGPPGMSVSKLEMTVLDIIDEIKDNFEPTPWHNTLNIVTYDLPITAKQIVEWAELFSSGSENTDARDRIMKAVPGMKNHPETEKYMTQMMLPFRSVVVGQVVAGVLDVAMGESGTGAKDEPASSKTVEEAKTTTQPEKQKKHSKLFPAHVHAAHHAKDIDDVLLICSYVPKHVKELRAHVNQQKKNKLCTRFAEYNLFYMTSAEETDDREWIEALMPFAKAGLAHAQYDVAQCCLALKREEEALAWMERAANIGHSKAMLGLAKLHLTKAFAAVKLMNTGGANRVKKATDAHTRAALKWLDVLCDADWDEETANDTQEGQKLLDHLEKEAAAAERTVSMKESESKAKELRSFLYKFFAAVALALACWWGLSTPREPTVNVEDSKPTHVNPYVKTLR